MNRGRADVLAALVVAAVVVVGSALTWQAYQQQRALDDMGTMMGGSMGAVHGTNPLWYAIGTLLVAAVVGGGYLAVRDDLARESLATTDAGAPSTDPANPVEQTPTDQSAATDGSSGRRARVLDVLPEDERRVLEPVLQSPGITQIALRDRSDFSKSKVSQTVSDLETRGLLYRERQGRTYRVYPGDDLDQDLDA
jgi:hypothetical protein